MISDTFSLKDKRILVTGASSGIGREIAIICSQFGAQLIITARDKTRLKETLGRLQGNNHEYAIADLTSKEDRDNLILMTSNIDGLVHAAGVVKLIPIKFYSEKLIRWFNSINYEAPVLLTNGLLKKNRINTSSSIVFISSIMSVLGIEGNGLYSGTKAALVGITKPLALELAPKEIRVNTISPGLVETPLLNLSDSVSKENIEKNIKLHPLGILSPNDVANSVVFLLSPASRMITGTNLIIDGGYSAK